MMSLPTCQHPVRKETEENPYQQAGKPEYSSPSSSHYQFTSIAKKWTPHLQYTAWEITQNRQVAEDIVQEAFLALWKEREKIIDGNPVGWLLKVVANLSVRYVKRRKMQIRIHNILWEEHNIDIRDVEQYLIVKETKSILNDIFRKLPSQQKLIFHLSKSRKLRREEIAAFLQISPNTVKVHLHRAMQSMKEQIAVITIILSFFICNDIFFKRSNTNASADELYTVETPESAYTPDKRQKMETPDLKMLNEINRSGTFLPE